MNTQLLRDKVFSSVYRRQKIVNGQTRIQGMLFRATFDASRPVEKEQEEKFLAALNALGQVWKN